MTDKSELIRVTVLVDGHTHEGRPVPKGAVIQVDKSVAAWMQQHQLGEPAGTATPTKESR